MSMDDASMSNVLRAVGAESLLGGETVTTLNSSFHTMFFLCIFGFNAFMINFQSKVRQSQFVKSVVNSCSCVIVGSRLSPFSPSGGFEHRDEHLLLFRQWFDFLRRTTVANVG